MADGLYNLYVCLNIYINRKAWPNSPYDKQERTEMIQHHILQFSASLCRQITGISGYLIVCQVPHDKGFKGFVCHCPKLAE